MRLFFILAMSIFTGTLEPCDQDAALKFQQDLSDFYARDAKSPLMEPDKKDFKGLDFFEIDANFCVQAVFKRTPNEAPFRMKTTTSRLPEYVKYGVLYFSLGGKSLKLNVYQNLDLAKTGYSKLFLPFSDLTNGEQTYIGGRYLDLEIPTDETATIDFNRAYNPYCAYNYAYSCPIVPMENDLEVAVLAGVKKYKD